MSNSPIDGYSRLADLYTSLETKSQKDIETDLTSLLSPLRGRALKLTSKATGFIDLFLAFIGFGPKIQPAALKKAIVQISTEDAAQFSDIRQITDVASKLQHLARTTTLGVETYKALSSWQTKGYSPENRSEAVTRVEAFLHDPNATELDLSGLNLKGSLEFFKGVRGLAERVKTLKLTKNNFKQLPSELSYCTKLTSLSVSGNPLKTIAPEYLSKLPSDERKHAETVAAIEKYVTEGANTTEERRKVGDACLAFLNDPNAKHLELSDYNLSSDIPFLANPPFSTRLQTVSLKHNRFQAIPEAFKHCTALKSLVCVDNPLSVLPDWLPSLPNLESLQVSWCQLTQLPNNIGECRNLISLNISHNRELHTLPVSLSQLPLQELYVTRLNLTTPVHLNLPQLRHTDYFNVTVANLTVSMDHSIPPPLAILNGKSLSAFPNLMDNKDLPLWLERMSGVSDHIKTPERREAFSKQLIEYLTLADTNEAFRALFFTRLEDANLTCGDRVALSVLQIDAAYKLATLDSSDMRGLASYLLRGPWILQQLESIAQQKIERLKKEIDDNPSLIPAEKRLKKDKLEEVEILMAFPIQLREKLNIAISLQSMLYLPLSNVSEKELSAAQDFISSQLEGDNRYEILCRIPEWQQALSTHFENPEDMTESAMIAKTKELLGPLRLSIAEYAEACQKSETLEQITNVAFDALDGWEHLIGETPSDATMVKHSNMLESIEQKTAQLLTAFDEKINSFNGVYSPVTYAAERGKFLDELIQDLSFADDPKFDRFPQTKEFAESLRALKLGFQAEQALLKTTPSSATTPPPPPVIQAPAFRSAGPDPTLIEQIKADWESKKTNPPALKQALAPLDRARSATINASPELLALRIELRKLL